MDINYPRLEILDGSMAAKAGAETAATVVSEIGRSGYLDEQPAGPAPPASTAQPARLIGLTGFQRASCSLPEAPSTGTVSAKRDSSV